ncbi:alpha/beta fold hydrolase [Arthrobacter sp. NPDC056727]|uniref:alpha/beta fold hydrolase n=1 Tax=Arthrobacter sp. NPDC056727 TaxID=3345927 RepID=UPI0036701A59
MLNTGSAKLYYEIRGSGPAMVLIPGAGGDAGYFSGVADYLADAFTVITYDRRGNSRSTGRVAAPMSVSDQSDDVAALISVLAVGPALVFGNSGGAIVALDLAARHPSVVLGMIAHEPPLVGVLPTDDPWYGFFERIGAVYRESGPAVAGAEFIATVRGEGDYPWPEDLTARFGGNVDYLFGWEWKAWGSYQPNLDALAKVSFPLVLGAGSADRGAYYARPSVEIARRINAPWVEFPGIHLEFLRNPDAFGAALKAVATLIQTQVGEVPEHWQKEQETSTP